MKLLLALCIIIPLSYLSGNVLGSRVSGLGGGSNEADPLKKDADLELNQGNIVGSVTGKQDNNNALSKSLLTGLLGGGNNNSGGNPLSGLMSGLGGGSGTTDIDLEGVDKLKKDIDFDEISEDSYSFWVIAMLGFQGFAVFYSIKKFKNSKNYSKNQNEEHDFRYSTEITNIV